MRRKDREIEDREAVEAILREADACRLGFAVENVPYIVTLNFGYAWEGEFPMLYFHCAREGRKLDMMRQNPRVCFELDAEHELVIGPAPCDFGMKFASIVGYGRLRELEDDSERRRALELLMRHYDWKGEGGFKPGPLASTCLLELQADEVVGKRKA
jgi:nitroimidazol reductase NimA-like FMN-containing flavoprotein (pyridoxamine 5'-phosphate oxidase superfamily)